MKRRIFLIAVTTAELPALSLRRPAQTISTTAARDAVVTNVETSNNSTRHSTRISTAMRRVPRELIKASGLQRPGIKIVFAKRLKYRRILISYVATHDISVLVAFFCRPINSGCNNVYNVTRSTPRKAEIVISTTDDYLGKWEISLSTFFWYINNLFMSNVETVVLGECMDKFKSYLHQCFLLQKLKCKILFNVLSS